MVEIHYKYLTTKEEADQCYHLSSMKENSYWLGGAIIPPIFIEAARKKGVILAKDDDKMIGFIHFNIRKKDKVAVIYHRCVHPDYRGQHIAWNLSIKVPPPREARCRPENEKIQSLYKKLGMRLWKKEHYVKKNGTEVNVLVYRTE